MTAYVHSPVEQHKECAFAVSLSHDNLETKYEQNWKFRRHDYFYAVLEMETRLHFDHSIVGGLAGWHKIESFWLPDFYLWSRHPVLSHNRSEVLRDETMLGWLLKIAESELVVLMLMSFLDAGESGILFRDSTDPRPR